MVYRGIKSWKQFRGLRCQPSKLLVEVRISQIVVNFATVSYQATVHCIVGTIDRKLNEKLKLYRFVIYVHVTVLFKKFKKVILTYFFAFQQVQSSAWRRPLRTR